VQLLLLILPATDLPGDVVEDKIDMLSYARAGLLRMTGYLFGTNAAKHAIKPFAVLNRYFGIVRIYYREQSADEFDGVRWELFGRLIGVLDHLENRRTQFFTLGYRGGVIR